MAGVYANGFDDLTTAQLTREVTQTISGGGAAIAITSAAARNGTSGLRFTHGNVGNYGLIRLSVPNQTTYTQGSSIMLQSLPPSGGYETVHAFCDTGTIQVDVRVLTTGALEATRNGTVLGTSTNTLLAGSKYYLESQVKVDPTTGTVTLQVNGVAWLTLTGQNTRATSTAQINQMQVNGVQNGLGPANYVDYDDWYVNDTTGSANTGFEGDSKVVSAYPTGAGSHTQFTPNPGTNANYQNVNEATSDDGTTYNSSATVGQIDSFPVTQLPAGTTVHFLVMVLVASKNDANARTLAWFVRQAGVDYANANTFAPSQGSWGNFVQVYDVDPTGAAWTLANANGDEYGYKEIA